MKHIHFYLNPWRTRDAKRKAVGLAFFSIEGELLLLKRSQRCDHPGTWALPAGGIEQHETPAQAVAREMMEETGYRLASTLQPRYVGQWENQDGTEFTLFRVMAPRFSPTLNDEHTAWTWIKPGVEKIPNLHPSMPGQMRALGLPML